MRVLPLLLLLVLPAFAASAEVFPSLRKHRKKHLVAVVQEQTHVQKQPDEVHTEDPQPDVVHVQDDSDSSAQPAQPVAPADVSSEAVGPVQPSSSADASAESRPQLPSISEMLSSASGTLKSVNTQASSLEANMVSAQMQIEAKMAKQRAAFDQKLKNQEEDNLAIKEQNKNISAEIESLKHANDDSKNHAHEMEQTNQLMRTELESLQKSLGGGKEFTVKALSSTDDSKSEKLQVLHPETKKASLMQTASNGESDDDDEDDDDDSNSGGNDDDASSFLSVSRKMRRQTPEQVAAAAEVVSQTPSSAKDLLMGISQEINRFGQQEAQSEKTLKQYFIRDYRAGAKRRQALLAQQKSLKATRDSLLTLQGQLKQAQAHLEKTHKRLEVRLHGLGHYLQKLEHLALAPTNEVTNLLNALPTGVTLKAKSA